jgi:glyoxylase-like metal-dependent hydrolase (beta-lactamase superfamily II)
MKALIKQYGSFEAEPISVDEQVSDGGMIGSLKVIHTPGHTPGHISLYYEKDKLLLGADSIYKHVFGAEGMYISAPPVSIDPVTAVVSAQRLSKVNFDKLLMAHQDSPLLEGARGAVETLVTESIQKLKR